MKLQDYLPADKTTISAAVGGTTKLVMESCAQAGRTYFVLGSLSGSSPGLQLGSIHVPLNLDIFTQSMLLNTPMFTGFSGTLAL